MPNSVVSEGLELWSSAVDSNRYDAILVPGGGLDDAGRLHPWVQPRFDFAIQQFDGQLIIPLSRGTVHKAPPCDQDGFPITEAEAGARYLIENGIPAHRIRPETCSLDTIGNALFSRLLHVDPLQLSHLLVITSDFHMARTEAIFRWIYGMEPARAELTFVPVSGGLSGPELDARVQREQESLARIVNLRSRLTTLHHVHEWLFTEHQAYANDRAPTNLGIVADSY
jgi:hypothetical protein